VLPVYSFTKDSVTYKMMNGSFQTRAWRSDALKKKAKVKNARTTQMAKESKAPRHAARAGPSASDGDSDTDSESD
jgi:hypothetical protein